MLFLKLHCVRLSSGSTVSVRKVYCLGRESCISAKLSQAAFPSRFMLGTDSGEAVGPHPWEVRGPLLLMCSREEHELPASGVRT